MAIFSSAIKVTSQIGLDCDISLRRNLLQVVGIRQLLWRKISKHIKTGREKGYFSPPVLF
jgi:hypothetical protein